MYACSGSNLKYVVCGYSSLLVYFFCELLLFSSPLLLFSPSSNRYCGHLDSSQRFLEDALRLRQALALAANTATDATTEETAANIAAANTAAAAAGGERKAREVREVRAARDEKKAQKAVVEGKGAGTGTVAVMEEEAANSPDIASSLHELGVLHIRRCEWETASVLLQRSLRMKRTLQHGQRSDFTRQGRFSEEAATLHQLAVVAMSCKPRRLEEAEQLLRQALESSRGPFMVRCVYVYVYVHVYVCTCICMCLEYHSCGECWSVETTDHHTDQTYCPHT